MSPKLKKNRRWLRVCWLMLLLGLANGCWDRRDLDDLSLVLAIGIDLKEDNLYQLTFQVIKPSEMTGAGGSGGGGGGGTDEAAVLIESQGVTVFDSIRNVTLRSSRRINFTHNRLLVIGKRAAEQGIRPLLDLMMRDAEPRPTQHVLVTPGEAVDVLKVKPRLEQYTALEIEKCLLNSGATSKVYPVILQDVMETLISRTTAVTMPIIRVDKSRTPETLVLGGQAVFDDDRWISNLNPKQTRGFLWSINRVKSGILLLSAADGRKVSMEIVRASGAMEPELTAKGLKMTLKVNLDLNLGSVMTKQKSLVSVTGFAKLAKQAEGYVKNEIKLAVKQAQQLKMDIFGFGSAVHRKYPRQWREMEPVWNEKFSELDVEIKVKASIRLTGTIIKAI